MRYTYRSTKFSLIYFPWNFKYNVLLNISITHTPVFSVYREVSSNSVMSGSTYSNSGGTVHIVTKVIVHEDVNFHTWDYDIALLQVCISFRVINILRNVYYVLL